MALEGGQLGVGCVIVLLFVEDVCKRCRQLYTLRRFENEFCVEHDDVLVCAVGAVFEQVFFRFGKFLAAFVFAKSICKDNIKVEQILSTAILFNLK